MGNSPSRPRLSKSMAELAQGECVTVVVGTEDSQKVYRLHAALLTEVSGFFQGCLLHDFVESETKKIHLPDDSPASFGEFVNWLYEGTTRNDPKNADNAVCLLEQYALGDKLICADFQKSVMKDSLLLHADNKIDPSQLTCLIEKGLGSSQMMQIYIWVIASEYVKNQVYYTANKAWEEFLVKDGKVTRDLIDAIHRISRDPKAEPADKDLRQWLSKS